MLFVGDDWAEDHHDVEIEDDAGRRLVRRRLPEGLAGWATLSTALAMGSGANFFPWSRYGQARRSNRRLWR
jgi:hypothetical protein